MLKKFAAIAAGLLFALNLHAAQQTIVTTLGSADNAPAGAAKINANFSELYARAAGAIFLTASGVPATDLANLNGAIALVASSTRLPPLAAQFFPGECIVLGPGTFSFTSGKINILSNTTQKVQGACLIGQGRGVTSIDYNPSTSQPFLINDHGLDVKMTDFTVFGHDVNSDFFWSQEHAGITNVQDYTVLDLEWGGSWNYIFRATGGNNNSEWKFSRDTMSGNVNAVMYVPALVATTITNLSNSIAATNTNEQVEVGDTGFFSAAVAPLAANTQYYVVSATTSHFQVATSFGGTPVTFTASGTPNFQTGSDQFLNFWFDKFKLDSGTSPGQWLVLNYGGSVKIVDSDISGHAPSASGGCIFNLLTQIHSGGVMDFKVDGLRIEHSSNFSCDIHSQWWRGNIAWNNLDESSQAGNRPITQVYANYELIQSGGPLVTYSNSQLMGTHVYTNQSNNFEYQKGALYENVTLLDNPTFANFITINNTGGNTGGFPLIECNHCRNYLVSTTAGYSEVVDTTLNWQFANSGVIKTRTVACLGANSDFPFSGSSFEIRLPLNAMVTQVRYWNQNGSGAAGAYQYTLETTEATPTVLAGGASTPMAGANASTPLPASSMYATNPNFIMTTDAQRTLQLVDTLSGHRTSAFTGPSCLIDYIG